MKLNWSYSGLAECAAFLFEHNRGGHGSAESMAAWFKGLVDAEFEREPRPTYISTGGFVATVYWYAPTEHYRVYMSVMTYTAQKACDTLKANAQQKG